MRTIPRPCSCGTCHLCHLAETDPRYQRLWGLPVTAHAKPRRVHSPSSPRKIPKAPQPISPSSYQLARTPIGKRHLSYHVYPVKGSQWRDYLSHVVSRWELFNGHKVFAVALDNTTDNLKSVKRLLPSDCTVLTFDNDPKLGETLTWTPRWVHLLSQKDITENDAVLYAHAKGVTRPVDGVCQEWSALLHTLMLDYWQYTEPLLRAFPIVGALRKHGNGFPPPSGGTYHFSGTFYWLRIKELLTKDYTKIASHRWGVESWPSEQYQPHEAVSLFGEFKDISRQGKWPEFGVYKDRKTWDLNVVPAYKKWVSARNSTGIPLAVITPCTRPDLLPHVYQSLDSLTDFNTSWYPVTSPGNTWGCIERNTGIDEITDPDTWVYFLDDDNTIHPRFPAALKDAIQNNPQAVGFVFRQTLKCGKTRLFAKMATKVGEIDTAQYVLKRSAIGDSRWPVKRAADFDFFHDVATKHPDSIVVVDQPACYYNALR